MAEAIRKTPGADQSEKTTATVSNNIPTALWDPTEFNVLNNFRTFNYLFTLSAMTSAALTKSYADYASIESSTNEFIVAKSGGKGKAGINLDQVVNAKAKPLIEQFNKAGAGRFDFYINNVNIDTLMSFSNHTNLAMATKMTFDVYEPYSINGFLESLQINSVAAGHEAGYIAAPFVFKVEFVGELDSNKSNSRIISTADTAGTRYFIIQITKVEIEVTENGTRYSCQAVAHNELAYGDQLALKNSVQMKGSTIGQIFKSLENALNEASKQANIAEHKANGVYDKFEIVFPEKNSDGSLNFAKQNKIAGFKLTELPASSNIYVFPDAGTVLNDNNAKQNQGVNCVNPNRKVPDSPGVQKYDSSNTIVHFPAGAKIHDILSAVVRDSEFGKRIVKAAQDNISSIIKNQFVEYAHIGVEVEIQNKFNQRTLRPAYTYRFIIIPFDLHFTRIPLFLNVPINVDELEKIFVKRKYNYLYTGQNVDIKSFNLKFNSLFYQAYPQGMGNFIFSNPAATQTNERQGKAVKEAFPGQMEKRVMPTASRAADPNNKNIVGTGGNATVRDYQTFDALVKNMHQAILDNLDMVTCELDILGDPYFLVTGGIGNYRPQLKTRGMTTTGEAPYQQEDIIIIVNFNNPEDIDDKTGATVFNKNKAPFSGCFRVTMAQSSFKDGMFSQKLRLIRIPGQPIEFTNVKVSEAGNADIKFAGLDDINIVKDSLVIDQNPETA